MAPLLPSPPSHTVLSVHLQGPQPPYLQLGQVPRYPTQLLLLLHKNIQPGTQGLQECTLLCSQLFLNLPQCLANCAHHCFLELSITTIISLLPPCSPPLISSLQILKELFQNPDQTMMLPSLKSLRGFS